MEEERKQIEKRVERAETKSKALPNYDPLYQAAKKLRIESSPEITHDGRASTSESESP